MKAKSTERNDAIKLRMRGHSLNEISTILKVSKASVSLWVRDIEVSSSAQKLILKKRVEGRKKSSATHKAITDSKVEKASLYAKKVLAGVRMNADTERLLCALIYWCEGVKVRRTNTPGFTNSDPKLVLLFLNLLRKGFEVDESKLRLTLHLHEYHSIPKQLRFWSELTTIPLSQCHKPYIKPHSGKRIRDGYPGCVTIRYFDTDFGRRLEAIAIEFLKEGL